MQQQSPMGLFWQSTQDWRSEFENSQFAISEAVVITRWFSWLNPSVYLDPGPQINVLKLTGQFAGLLFVLLTVRLAQFHPK